MLDDEDEIKQNETPENPDSPETEEDGRSVSSDLIRGHINTIILRALYEEDKYGYQIIADIEDKSHGQYSLKQPSLYSALKRLEKEGCITSYWGSSVNGGRRKYFSLTELGKQIAERNQSEWEYSRTIIDSLISDRDFDFSNPAPNSVNMRILRDTTSRVPSSEKGAEPEDESAIRAALEQEYAEKCAALERKQAELEEQHTRLNEELSRRRSELMKENEWRERELAAREEQLESALGCLATPPDTTERDEVEEQLRDHIRALEEEISALQYDKLSMQEEIVRAEQKVEDERAARTQILEEERRKIIDEEQQRTAQLVEEERIRITEEFKARETVLMRRNYTDLRQQAIQSTTSAATEKPYPTASEHSEPPAYSGETGDYKTTIRNILSTSLSHDKPAAVKTEKRAASPAVSAAIADTRSIDGYDFHEMKQAAKKDGLRIVTVGEGETPSAEEETQSLVHKGKALFLSSLAAFFFCLVLGAILLGARTSAQIAAFYPYLVWCVGVAVLLVAGLAYANHYGERSIRRTSIILIVNAVVIYTLLVILSLIVALAAQIDFTSRVAVLNFIVVPIVFSLIVPLFGIVYFLLVKTRKTKH